eukprot:894036-Prorocentrum_minimum.AAC.1
MTELALGDRSMLFVLAALALSPLFSLWSSSSKSTFIWHKVGNGDDPGSSCESGTMICGLFRCLPGSNADPRPTLTCPVLQTSSELSSG